jgi:hypothetical protein
MIMVADRWRVDTVVHEKDRGTPGILTSHKINGPQYFYCTECNVGQIPDGSRYPPSRALGGQIVPVIVLGAVSA